MSWLGGEKQISVSQLTKLTSDTFITSLQMHSFPENMPLEHPMPGALTASHFDVPPPSNDPP